jgi:hypothetical protein
MTSQPDTYHDIRNDLDTMMGDLESAHLLAVFIVMRETEAAGNRLSPDFVGALHSVQNLLEMLKERGDAMVGRMMDLERPAGKAVAS